jgi:hypothetical protein
MSVVSQKESMGKYYCVNSRVSHIGPQQMGRFAESLHIAQVEELNAVNCMKYC